MDHWGAQEVHEGPQLVREELERGRAIHRHQVSLSSPLPRPEVLWKVFRACYLRRRLLNQLPGRPVHVELQDLQERDRKGAPSCCNQRERAEWYEVSLKKQNDLMYSLGQGCLHAGSYRADQGLPVQAGLREGGPRGERGRDLEPRYESFER